MYSMFSVIKTSDEENKEVYRLTDHMEMEVGVGY